jgi:tetratricopeptide (TPR) repeat protein
MNMKRLWLIPACLLSAILLLSAVRHYRGSAKVVSAASERVYAYCAVPDRSILDRAIDSTKPVAPRLQGLGDYHWEVSTAVPETQAFFDQGIRLYYGFNHLEAWRAFTEAARLDPECAMCYWGQALTLGPNINAPMDPADESKVLEAVNKAMALQDKASPKEKALINAIAKRYVVNAPADRRPLDEAYAAAMKETQQQFPEDPDVAALYAEAIMDLHPWDYWQKNGDPQPWSPEILQLLEGVLARSADHPGGHHFYIHAVEASATPEKGMASADRLRTLMPNAGHLVHMPAHIYIRTGKYHEGSLTNEESIKADLAYLTECNAQGLYALMYHPHNYHFLWACATLEGRSEVALKAAADLQSKSDSNMMLSPFGYIIQHLYSTPVFAMVRFGKWNELLQMPAPNQNWKFVTAMWHYGRGIAYTRKGQISEAGAEADALAAIRNDTSLKSIETGARNSAYLVMEIAEKVVRGEIAAHKKDYPAAIETLTAAMQLEDKLLYNEPVDWHHPVREVLGEVLLQARQYDRAQEYYQQDLRSYPESGWALMGLYKSLQAQGKQQDAAAVKKRYDKAFGRADIKLTASRI